MARIILLIVFYSFSLNAMSSIYQHGYIGSMQFDIKEERFNLKNTNHKCKYLFKDAHFHPRDFTMQGEPLAKIATQANANCIDKILLNSLPLINHWGDDSDTRPSYYTDDKSKFYWNSVSDIPTFEEYKKLDKKTKEKFYFLINGFLHFDRSAKQAVLQTIESYKDLPIVGFGEIFGDHDIMSDQMNPPSTINSKAMDEIYEIAAKKNWFVLFHNNISHRSFKGATGADYLNKVELMLSKHRKTTFIWAHSGIMRNIVIENLTEIIDNMLAKHSNLYIDISFVVYENYIMARGKPDAEWILLIEKYPERFLFGTDDLASYKEFNDVKKYIPLLDSLSLEAAENLAGKNLQHLINKALSK
jgi:predicted TIM-barrel fold metal-dependent hydrolase